MALSIDFINDRAPKTIGATRAFPVGTPEGDTLRSTIPTPEPPKQR